MSYNKLVSELNNNDKKIEVSLDWDLGRGIFEDKEYVFDWLDSFAITFDLWIFGGAGRSNGHPVKQAAENGKNVITPNAVMVGNRYGI